MKTYKYKVGNEIITVVENNDAKIVRSPSYNYDFDKKTGFFRRWGKTFEDDPQFSPISPEIADIEVTTICHGVSGQSSVAGVSSSVAAPCRFCYKSNTPNGINMSLEDFKRMFDLFPKLLCQIAFGADSRATSNPDLFEMMQYCRDNGVIPNITVADISDETADKLAKVCGAVAVSRYANKNVCYDSVKKLTDRGMKQVNIHALASAETVDMLMETLQDRLTDPRLANLNAIVMLSLKKKGRGKTYNKMDQKDFNRLVEFALQNKITIGFDSCGCGKFLESIKGRPDYKAMETASEPCESYLFSFYANADCQSSPCSFCEGESDWESGIDLKNCKDFINEVWLNPKAVEFREQILRNNRKCFMFDV